MRIAPTWIAVAAMFFGFIATPAGAAIDSAATSAAIKKAQAYLYAQQKDGHWEKAATSTYPNDNVLAGGQWGGVTALATYALIASGESPQDPRLVKAIEFLEKADIRGTYALAVRMQVWLLLPESKKTLAMAKHDAQMLLDATQTVGSAAGMHDYSAAGKTYSHSRSQYAVLGLWAAEQMGIEVPTKYWEMSEAGWLDHQDISGGWTYKKKNETEVDLTPGMTAPGVATLFITQDYLHAAKAVDCKGTLGNPTAAAIDKGVEWLTKHFDMIASDKAYSRAFPYATLYSVERVGVAGGLKYFGAHDWFDKGMNWLLKKQKADGGFGGAGEVPALFTPTVDTSFALLFMARGRAPVAFAKLDYSADNKPAPWNQRPRDIANVVRWIGRSMEHDLNWQVVNLKVDPVELLDAPIIYMAGTQPLALTDEQAAKIKAYIEMGGLVVGNADCNGVGFANTFRKLGEKLFPAYEFRELPPTHPAYNANYKYATWRNKPAVQGLSNGSREMMLLIHAGDPARLWQVRASKGREEAWQLPANFYFYVTDRTVTKYKGDSYWVTPDPKITGGRKVAVARLEYPGNWDPEPGGWRRLSAIMHNRDKVDLEVKSIKLGEGALKVESFKIAHLTGTAKYKFTDAMLDELRKFTAGGGLLIIDSTGGASEFSESADGLIKTLFPSVTPSPLPENHPAYLREGKPVPIAYRAAAQRIVGNIRTGRLMGAQVNDRLAIIISHEDLSTGMVGQSVEGVVGYAPATAAGLMENMVLMGGK